PTLRPNSNLNERYHQMKANSQTFQDYKVIKEVRLDEFWKMTMDSARYQRQQLNEAKQTIALLTGQLKQTGEAVKSIQASTADLVYNSRHISFFGVPFNKWLFNFLVLGVTGGLVFLLLILLGRGRLISTAIKEKTDSLQAITDEFEQYKRKALEKEKKLSRELQTERNKLLELKRA
ncbi:MAG: hypothetical protein ACKOE6_10055, partial [Flammeovirgaceae bacterium]